MTLDSKTYQSRSIALGHSFLIICSFSLVALLIWAYIGRLDIVTVAEGVVVPSTKIKTVQHLEGGIIRKINVNHKGEETIIINDEKIDCIKFILNASKHPKDKGPFSETTLWYSKDKELMKFNFKNPKDSSIINIVRKK